MRSFPGVNVTTRRSAVQPRWALVLLLLFPAVAMAQDYTGVYVTPTSNGQITLTVRHTGTQVTGVLVDDRGGRYQVVGTVDDEGALSGELTNENGMAAIGAALDGEALIVYLIPFDADNAPMYDAANEFVMTRQAEAGGSEMERDPRLIGHWAYSETYTSGTFSGTSQVFLQVNPDGTYTYGNGRVMAGTPGVSGDTGRSGEGATGQWHTQGNTVYIMETGTSQWVPFARYYLEAGKMLLTFGDGSKQLWYRQ